MMSERGTLQEFNQRFTCVVVVDKTILDSSKVLLFLKAVDVKDRRDLGLLLEN